MADDEDVRDAALFRLWVKLGSERPPPAASAIATRLWAALKRQAVERAMGVVA